MHLENSIHTHVNASRIHLTEQTSVHVGDPQLPKVGQLTNHHVRQLLHELHLLRGFKAPGCNREAMREVKISLPGCLMGFAGTLVGG